MEKSGISFMHDTYILFLKNNTDFYLKQEKLYDPFEYVTEINNDDEVLTAHSC